MGYQINPKLERKEYDQDSYDLNNKKLLERNIELERKLAELSFLYEMTNRLMNNHDLLHLLNSILEMAIKLTQSEVGCILLRESPHSNNFNVRIDSGNLDSALKSLLVEKSLNLGVLNPQIKILKDGDMEFSPFRCLDSSLRSLMAVPLQVDSKIIGFIIIMHKHCKGENHRVDYSNDDCHTSQMLAQQAALILHTTMLKSEYSKKDMYIKTITTLTSAIDAKDGYTKNHSNRVADLAVALGRKLQLGENSIQNIQYGAILHDIGKIGIQENILNKNGRLSKQEFNLVKAHPVTGAKILEPIDFPREVRDIVRHHHERYDGTGYPDCLQGESIPYVARIVAVADAWDAMTSHRSYRKALTFEEAVAELNNGSAKQFDPYLISAFIKMLE